MNRLITALVCLLVLTSVSVPAFADRDFKGHRGYRERPYDPHRHYERHEFRHHHYNYRGHWRSWDDWDRYYRAYPHLHRHGGYYWEGSHLMFRYCEPDGNACFFFSIGQ